MPHSFGYRARTRHLFRRDFRKHGAAGTSKYLAVFKIGDIVDVKGQGNIHKGMPHKYYHGKTGIVWNVTPRAVGVEMQKTVGNRKIVKRIHCRIEHVQHSNSRKDFLQRVKSNTAKQAEAKTTGKRATLKRQPKGPKGSGFVKKPEIDTIFALPYAGIPV